MYARPLVPRFELVFHEWGAFALLVAVAGRLVWGYASDGHLWLLDSQILVACLLLALLNVLGCVVPRNPGTAASVVLGGITWFAALSLIPRYGWPMATLPPWLMILGAAVLLLCIVLRMYLRQRWLYGLRGRGHRGILDWAVTRPLYARRLAQSVLRSLGYDPNQR